jgi:hypothetical protein
LTGITQSPVSDRDREAARWIADEVTRAGGRLRLSASTLLALFEAERLDPAAGGRVEDALGGEGLECAPRLRDGGVRSDDLVDIRTTRRVDVEDEPPIEPVPKPGVASVPAPAQVVAERAQALPAAALTAGAAVPGVLLALVGFASWWVYGLLFVGLAGGVWWLAKVARVWLARIFLLPLGRPWLTGFALTALPLALMAVLAALFVVAPVASERAAQAREDDARARLVSAQRALASGDLQRSRRDLAAARESDPDVAGAPALERRIDEAQARRDAELERRQTYERVAAALSDDDEAEALRLLAGLEGYRDSYKLAERARRGLAGEQLSRARVALYRGDFARARDLGEQSLDTRATGAARRVVSEARAGLRRERARARARARAEARARARRRAEARRRAAERREQRRLERQREEQAQAPPAAPPAAAPSVPSGTCSEIGMTDFAVPPGDPRDADGDGIACES